MRELGLNKNGLSRTDAGKPIFISKIVLFNPFPGVSSAKYRNTYKSSDIEGVFVFHSDFAIVSCPGFRVIDCTAVPISTTVRHEILQHAQTKSFTLAECRIGVVFVQFFLPCFRVEWFLYPDNFTEVFFNNFLNFYSSLAVTWLPYTNQIIG